MSMGESASLERLYRALEPLKLYALRRLPGGQPQSDGRPGSLIDCELAAYAAGFERLGVLLEEIRRQAFVQTADSRGLAMYEKLLGLGERAGLPLESRRELALYRLAVAPLDFHLEGMHNSVLAAGIEAEITEHFTQESLTVRCNRLIDPSLDTGKAKARLDAMLPAHLDYHFDFGEMTWDMFEQAEADWDRWDGLDFTWEAFDLNGHGLFAGGE